MSLLPPGKTRQAQAANGNLSLMLVVLCAAAVGCGDSKQSGESSQETQTTAPPANDCNAVGVHLAALTRQKLTGMEGRDKKIMQTQLQLVREKFIKTCESEKWSAEVRSCMIAAADVGKFNACTAPLRKARGLPPPAGESNGKNAGENTAKPAGTSPSPQPAPPTPAPSGR